MFDNGPSCPPSPHVSIFKRYKTHYCLLFISSTWSCYSSIPMNHWCQWWILQNALFPIPTLLLIVWSISFTPFHSQIQTPISLSSSPCLLRHTYAYCTASRPSISSIDEHHLYLITSPAQYLLLHLIVIPTAISSSSLCTICYTCTFPAIPQHLLSTTVSLATALALTTYTVPVSPSLHALPVFTTFAHLHSVIRMTSHCYFIHWHPSAFIHLLLLQPAAMTRFTMPNWITIRCHNNSCILFNSQSSYSGIFFLLILAIVININCIHFQIQALHSQVG